MKSYAVYTSILSPFNPAGSEAAGADTQPFIAAVHLTFHFLDVGFPNRFGLSIGMAHIIAELDTLATNITFCHLDTSSTFTYSYNIAILPEIYWKSK